jgi:replicative DNA helicase
MASDLRDSGEVEQDADIIAMIHREELYDKSHEWQGVAELLIRKNRNGQTGEVLLNFNGALMRFEAVSSGKVSPRYMQTTQNSRSVGFYNPHK